MVVRKRKKNTRQRGSRTHGWGLIHRNSGQRGGAGNAGRGKKSHCKKPQIWNEPYLGKFGFVRHGQHQIDYTIAIKDIEQQLPNWITTHIATKTDDTYTIDLAKAGYTKLLATGHPTHKLAIKVRTASKTAVEKINAAGGTVAAP